MLRPGPQGTLCTRQRIRSAARSASSPAGPANAVPKARSSAAMRGPDNAWTAGARPVQWPDHRGTGCRPASPIAHQQQDGFIRNEPASTRTRTRSTPTRSERHHQGRCRSDGRPPGRQRLLHLAEGRRRSLTSSSIRPDRLYHLMTVRCSSTRPTISTSNIGGDQRQA